MRVAGVCDIAAFGLVLGLASCGLEQAEPVADGAADGGETEGDDDSGGVVAEEDPLPEGHARVRHTFGVTMLDPLEETQPCIQWSLNNDEPIYINRVTLTNHGGFHHSNWFVVPEAFAEGPDGFFRCGDRGFTEIEAALQGTVLTAQSTQSRFETMQLPEGVVVKAPPHHKIVAGGHLLNLANAPYETELKMELEIIHPREVEVVTAPFRLSYLDLDIPAFSEARFSGDCSMESLYRAQSGQEDFDLTLYYVLPHYHYLGNYFDLSILGGPRDGESVFRLDGFNADSNGAALDPPLTMTGAEGFSFTCGYNNWRDKSIGWGIGDQEMCVMLGLADSRVLMDASVVNGSVVGNEDGIVMNSGKCDAIGLPKNPSQTPPTQEEIDGELYIPPSDDIEMPSPSSCKDIGPETASFADSRLSRIRDTLFVSTCQFSACHSGENSIGGLDLAAEDLHGELLSHEMRLTNTSMKLVEPGDPDNSYLYKVLTQCDPLGDGSEPHMPLNSPELVHPKLAAMVRGWIANGALDN